MKRFSSPATVLLATACLVVWSCAATPKIPLEDQHYIEGTIVEGGALSFILRDDSGKELRFAAYHDAVYNPPEFHALAGDRLGVTYGVTGGTTPKTVALQVALLSPAAQRTEMASPAVGIIREAGMTRHKIHLPENNFTVVMLKGKNATSTPGDWKPETGDKIRVQFSETSGRFMRKTFYDTLELLEKGPILIRDYEYTGTIVDRDQGSVTVRSSGGQMNKFYLGPETKVYPEDDGLSAGGLVQIVYYKKLMGDRTIRPTATIVNKIK
ncbi:MAG: hypothetical protein AMJ54_15225 [Deltaproteobacteria bacterium SG8_13]|nr:MAG: hypothetical protein AMJ54_15225 [Deltaproteobacteria bacterium SG8_13]